MPINIAQPVPGIAAFDASDVIAAAELFNNAIPHPVTEDFPVGASTDLKAYSVVGLSAAGNLVLAQTSGTAVVPIGITVTGAKTGAGQTDRIAVYRAGNFNPAALTWHADYDTAEKKAAAFRGAPAPTNILIRERL